MSSNVFNFDVLYEIISFCSKNDFKNLYKIDWLFYEVIQGSIYNDLNTNVTVEKYNKPIKIKKMDMSFHTGGYTYDGNKYKIKLHNNNFDIKYYLDPRLCKKTYMRKLFNNIKNNERINKEKLLQLNLILSQYFIDNLDNNKNILLINGDDKYIICEKIFMYIVVANVFYGLDIKSKYYLVTKSIIKKKYQDIQKDMFKVEIVKAKLTNEIMMDIDINDNNPNSSVCEHNDVKTLFHHKFGIIHYY